MSKVDCYCQKRDRCVLWWLRFCTILFGICILPYLSSCEECPILPAVTTYSFPRGQVSGTMHHLRNQICQINIILVWWILSTRGSLQDIVAAPCSFNLWVNTTSDEASLSGHCLALWSSHLNSLLLHFQDPNYFDNHH